MPVLPIASPKGGVGKTSTAILLAVTLAEAGARVAVIGCDPNNHIRLWASLAPLPPGITVFVAKHKKDEVPGPCIKQPNIIQTDIDEKSLEDLIQTVASQHTFVIVDLEGTANYMVGLSTSMADLVIIPMQASPLDAQETAKAIKLIREQEKALGRRIPLVVVFTKTPVAIVTKTQRSVIARLHELGIPTLKTQVHERDALKQLFYYGGSVSGYGDKGVPSVAATVKNGCELTSEVLAVLQNLNSDPESFFFQTSDDDLLKPDASHNIDEEVA